MSPLLCSAHCPASSFNFKYELGVATTLTSLGAGARHEHPIPILHSTSPPTLRDTRALGAMPLSVPSAPAVLKALPRALSLAAAAVAAATASLLIISVVVSNSHHASSSSSSSPPQLPPSASASTTAALAPAPAPDHHHHPPPEVPPCPPNATHDVPCHEPPSGERHCPPRPPPPPLHPHPPKDPPPHPPHPPPPPHCRVPPPPGYRPPPPWPARRDRARYANVDLPVQVAAGHEHEHEHEQDPGPGRGRAEWLVFTDTDGVQDYVEQLERVVPLRGGVVRTALDIGCGVASFGDYLLSYGVLTMSIAPRNTRLGAPQVQVALERGLPAMIGVLAAHRLPYPSRSFDMVHCADCLVPGTAHDGRLYMLEIDRLLQPGGYWVFSKPPVNWKSTYNISNEATRDIQDKQLAMDDLSNKLHWTKVYEEGTVSVWRKPYCHLRCDQEANAKLLGLPPLCKGEDPDTAWYANISMCVTCIPRAESFNGCDGAAMEKWPERLVAVPPRIASGEMKNVMDMSAGFGGFAAAMSKHLVWVMNVVPANTTENTLGAIYERGLIGTYTDWCEAFSTYPRTYDLIHGNGIFSSHIHKCGIIDILVEMDRILRPGGAVIVRDRADVVLKVKKDADRLRWHSRVVDTEDGPLDPEKLLIVDKFLPLPGS